MFQRLREAIDSRIAEEQARQKAAQDSISRSSSTRRAPPSSGTDGRRPPRPRRNTGTPVRGPDPTEFESEFAIGGDEESSRSATPRLETENGTPATDDAKDDKDTAGESSEAKDTAPAQRVAAAAAAPVPTNKSTDADAMQVPSEVPTEIRAKLRRLDKLESKYHELLRAYRIAHARVLSIEPFEAALRENTPLTSIGDPKALTEYLGQISLKGDMVLDELKRVTTERDDFKKKLDEAQASASSGWDEVANLKKHKSEDLAANESKESEDKSAGLKIDTAATKDDSTEAPLKSPASSIVSRTSKIPGISIFSPKQTAAKSPSAQQENEEFFSFDNEIPRLETELQERREEVESLKTQVENLKKDLSVARESTEGMVQNLEYATRELSELRDEKDKHEAEITSIRQSKQAKIDELNVKLVEAEATVAKMHAESQIVTEQLKAKTEELEQLRARNSADKSEAKLDAAEKDKEAQEKRLGVLQGLVTSLRTQLKDTEKAVVDLKTDLSQKNEDMDKLQNIVNFVDRNLKEIAPWQRAKEQVANGQDADFDEIRKGLVPTETTSESSKGADARETPSAATATSGGKKKKNKKKKAGKSGDEPEKAPSVAPSEDDWKDKAEADSGTPSKLAELEQKIASLSAQLVEKETAIDRLCAKLKGEEDLKEEIETLRDEVLNLGQEHVEAKDKIKELAADKTALEVTISKLEKDLVYIRTSHVSNSADSQKVHDDLKSDFESMTAKAATLETDLAAAQQLATSRFKDLTELRETLQRIQPELRSLRAESAELKMTKDTLAKKTAELKSLEGKYEDVRVELKSLKSKVSERDAEVKTLNQKIRQETDSRLKAEDSLSTAQSDLRASESKKQEAVDAREKTVADLVKAQDELKTARSKVRDLDEQVSRLTQDLSGLREEIQLKTAQYASAQSLMNSMRDQTTEVAMQMKEARERCESLEEELVDAHRLLSERTREGETMRRLLNDIEGRTDAKVREFKERMEAAIEERDRAEDEASSLNRRRAREMEELKVKVREAERALRSAQQDKEELEYAQKEWKRRREELESQSDKSLHELNDVRQAMTQLRDALDEAEKQVRQLDKEKIELRRAVEESNTRLEKLRKTNKALSEEVRSAQQQQPTSGLSGKAARGLDSGVQSSRSSIDSGSRRAVGAPAPASARRTETPTGTGSGTGTGTAPIDYIYLKNVLLQFLEHKDRNYQKQLIPVLGMLLHFDRNDEQKWMAAITSK